METPESDLLNMLNRLTLRDIDRELNERILASHRECEGCAECEEAIRRSARMWREDFEAARAAARAANGGVDPKLSPDAKAELARELERRMTAGLHGRGTEAAAKEHSAASEDALGNALPNGQRNLTASVREEAAAPVTVQPGRQADQAKRQAPAERPAPAPDHAALEAMLRRMRRQAAGIERTGE